MSSTQYPTKPSVQGLSKGGHQCIGHSHWVPILRPDLEQPLSLGSQVAPCLRACAPETSCPGWDLSSPWSFSLLKPLFPPFPPLQNGIRILLAS